MRILTLSDLWLPFPGGAERLAFNLARDWHRRGHKVHVLTGYEYPQTFDGPPVTDCPLPLDDEGWALIRQTIRMDKPDVILTHHLYAHTFGERLVATGIPVVQVVLNGQRLKGAALAVYISRWVRDQAGDAEPQDLVITPPAFDDVVSPTHGDAIGFIKPIPHKGVRLVYDIARAMPERQFVILRGEWQDLEVIEHLPNIEFMEPVDDIREFYARCRLVLMPSLSEDAGTCAQECALNDIPCISTMVGGLAETNAYGLKLLLAEPLSEWLRIIDELDDPAMYANVVDSQRYGLKVADHAGSLDLLAERIGTL
jgi:glycosyltransferase involved in cell wall biosynthesis